MSIIYNLPNCNTNVYTYILSSHSIMNLIPVVISHTLYQYVRKLKDILYNSEQKHIDQYEYIYSILPVKTSYSSSYYNMVEIYKTFNILEQLSENCKSFHFTDDIDDCGCMESLKLCRRNNLDQCIKTQTNDFFNINKVQECYTMHHGSCHLVTGYYKQGEEILQSKLLFTQCIYAFACQKKNGHFILKISDIYTQPTIDILYILSSLYERVQMYKPYTSNPLTSERYVICMKFRLEDTKDLVDTMCLVLKDFIDTTYPDRFLQCDIPYSYMCGLQDINAILGQSQLEYMNVTLKHLQGSTNETTDCRIHHHHKCIQWCKKFNLHDIFK